MIYVELREYSLTFRKLYLKESNLFPINYLIEIYPALGKLKGGCTG